MTRNHENQIGYLSKISISQTENKTGDKASRRPLATEKFTNAWFVRIKFLYLHVLLKVKVMDSKLTLKLNESVIERAKQYASSKRLSLSRLIENYLNSLTDRKSVV